MNRVRPGGLVACPDARQPAYQAVIGLARAGLLGVFATSFFDRGGGLPRWLAGVVGSRARGALERRLARRGHPAIPAERVVSRAWVDVSLALESRLASRQPRLRRSLARLRTDRFDRAVARHVEAFNPPFALLFSDVGSVHALEACRRNGIATALSVVHGDVFEERQLLEEEAARSPRFFPIYLGDGRLDRAEMNWLHERRLREQALADLLLVPSRHIAERLVERGTSSERIRVVPYAADSRRFCPRDRRGGEPGCCTFLFAGGITQRKGIGYLLEAWRQVRRPGWTLQLLGERPVDSSPLEPYRDMVEWLGRVGHAEMPAHMRAADVFVFPSLFEGSAVVTYEAMACGLPLITTSEAGSVARDGCEGLLVPAASIAPLAQAIERLGRDAALRETLSQAARERALEFNWQRYQDETTGAVAALIARQPQPA